MCSDSLGSIRAAIKKLLDSGMVTCHEYVERSVNKKQYSITDAGRKQFMDWACTPADVALSKNMELGKFLFMGFVPEKKRQQLLNEIITGMENTLSAFTDMKSSIDISAGKAQAVASFEKDSELCEGLLSVTKNSDVNQVADDIGKFQMLCLQYEIDTLSFQIEWFKGLREGR